MTPADRIDALRDAIQHLLMYISDKRRGAPDRYVTTLAERAHQIILDLAIPGSFTVPDADVSALLHQLRTDAVAATGHGVASVAVLERLKAAQDTLLDWRSLAGVDTPGAAPDTASPSGPPRELDGFVPPTGWRWRGKVVTGLSSLQLNILMSLWNEKMAAPRGPVTVTEVIKKAYPRGTSSSDPKHALRQRWAAINKRMDGVGVRLNVEPEGVYLSLKPLSD
jgi:hypothetical protein